MSYQNGVPEQYFALEMWKGYIANVVAGQFQQHLSSENIFINSKKKKKKIPSLKESQVASWWTHSFEDGVGTLLYFQ